MAAAAGASGNAEDGLRRVRIRVPQGGVPGAAVRVELPGLDGSMRAYLAAVPAGAVPGSEFVAVLSDAVRLAYCGLQLCRAWCCDVLGLSGACCAGSTGRWADWCRDGRGRAARPFRCLAARPTGGSPPSTSGFGLGLQAAARPTTRAATRIAPH